MRRRAFSSTLFTRNPAAQETADKTSAPSCDFTSKQRHRNAPRALWDAWIKKPAVFLRDEDGLASEPRLRGSDATDSDRLRPKPDSEHHGHAGIVVWDRGGEGDVMQIDHQSRSQRNVSGSLVFGGEAERNEVASIVAVDTARTGSTIQIRVH